MADINKSNFNADGFTIQGPPKSNSAESNDKYYSYDTTFRGAKGDRRAFRLSTADGLTSFLLWINPSECNWRVPLRTTIEQIQGGAVHHEWDSIGVGVQQQQKFDQAVINFTFQSGNLTPMGHLDVSKQDIASYAAQFKNPFAESSDTKKGDFSFSDLVTTPENLEQPYMPPGLGNFYDFLELLNAPNIQADGSPNYVVIDYLSMVFPLMRLRGFFSQEGVQWNDTSDNPLGITSWGASFVVFDSNPPLFSKGRMTEAYSSFFNNIYRNPVHDRKDTEALNGVKNFLGLGK